VVRLPQRTLPLAGVFALAAALLMVPASNAMAQTGMSIDVTTTDGSDIVISGMTTKSDPIAVRIVTQHGNVVFVDQDSPDADGSFEFVAKAGIIGWTQDGIYTIEANQSQSSSSSTYNLSVNVLVEGGQVTDTSAGSKSSLIGMRGEELPERMATEDPGLEFTADAQPGASVIRIEGMTTSMNTDVTVIVEAPNGNKIHTGQVTPSRDGSFAEDIMIGCPQWEQDGDYMISVQQGPHSVFKKSAEVEISECLVVPEFGAVAMAVMAVAIIAAIALTARSRIGLVPRL